MFPQGPVRWRDPRQAYLELMAQQQAMQQQQQPQPQGGGGNIVGDIVGGIVRPFAQFANQGIKQLGQIEDTKRMLMAQATGNTEAWRNANESAKRRNESFGDKGGLLNMGTITNAEETARGDFNTGARKIGGTTAMIGATIAPVGKAATVLGRGAQAAAAGGVYGAGESLNKGGSLEDVLTNTVKGGAVGGVIGAGPLNLLRGAAGAGKAAVVGDDVLQTASQFANKSLTRKAGQALTGASDDLAIKQFRLTPSQLKNFKSKFGEDAGQTIQKYGFSNVDDITTKGIDPLQQQFDQAITGITGVTKDSLKQSFDKRIAQLSKAGPSDSQAIGKQLQQEANSILKRYGDVIDANELNSIRREFDSLVNYTEKVSNPARYGVNKRMADAIRETLQQSDQTGTLKGVGRELQKLRQLQDNALKQSELGRGSLPLNLPTLLGGGMGAAAGGPVGAVGMAMGTAAANSPTGRRLTMKGVSSLGTRLSNAGSRQPGVGRGLLAKGAAIGATQTRPSSPEPTPEQTLEEILGGSAAMQPQVMPQQSANPYSQENLMADIQRDPENAADYLKYYTMLEDVFNPQTQQKPLSGEAQKRALTAQSGLRSLDALNQTLQTDPGAFQRQALPNPLGITARLTGTTGVRAATDNIVDVIARLRSGAAITDEEAKRFARLLPQPGDSQEAALTKLQNVQMELESFAYPQATSNSLEDMLLQQGAF